MKTPKPRDNFVIPIPVDPTEMTLPRSTLRYQLCGGKVVTIQNIPLQGPKALDSLLATIKVWKPSIVTPDLDYQI